MGQIFKNTLLNLGSRHGLIAGLVSTVGVIISGILFQHAISLSILIFISFILGGILLELIVFRLISNAMFEKNQQNRENTKDGNMTEIPEKKEDFTDANAENALTQDNSLPEDAEPASEFDIWDLHPDGSEILPVIVLKPNQTLNSRTTVELENILVENQTEQKMHVILDLSKVSFVNSTGIGFIVKMRSEANSEGSTFSICCAGNEIISTLKMIEILDSFKIFDTLEDVKKHITENFGAQDDN